MSPWGRRRNKEAFWRKDEASWKSEEQVQLPKLNLFTLLGLQMSCDIQDESPVNHPHSQLQTSKKNIITPENSCSRPSTNSLQGLLIKGSQALTCASPSVAILDAAVSRNSCNTFRIMRLHQPYPHSCFPIVSFTLPICCPSCLLASVFLSRRCCVDL